MRTLIGIVVPATTFLVLVAVGLSLTAEDFARVARQRALVLVGLLAPLVLLPLIAIALAREFQAPAAVTGGVLLLAACPIGSVANMYTQLARASTALSVTLTGLSCVCAAVTIPLTSTGIELALARPLDLEAPIAALAVQLLLVLALPVAIGMWLRRRSPPAVQWGPTLQRVAVVSLLVVLVLIIVDDWAVFAGELRTTIPLAAGFVVASIVAGWMAAALVTRDRRDRFAIAAGFGARNVAIATAIAVTILGRVEFARFAAIYSLVEVPLMLIAIALFRASATARTGRVTGGLGSVLRQ